MASTTSIRTGMTIVYKDQPWLVATTQFVNPGKGAAFTRTKLKNLKTGQTVEVTFKSGESVDLADVVNKKCQYLYADDEGFHFMENDTYEQFYLDEELIGNNKDYLLEGTECYAVYIDGVPVSIQLPPKMDFKVISAPPGAKGDTATTETKECTIETGATIKVPGFIKEGETIKVNTEDGNYVGRA